MKSLLNSDEFNTKINNLCLAIAENINLDNLALIGIHTRGVPLAERIHKVLSQKSKHIALGSLDINLYRDDLSEVADMPIIKESNINFDIEGKTVFLVDDVLYTGRTIRAGMDALFDLGRPRQIHLAVMAKRNGRELPIDTPYFGIDVATECTDNIKVKFLEIDGEDSVTLQQKGDKAKELT